MKKRICTLLLCVSLFAAFLLCACAKQGPVEGKDPVQERYAQASSIYAVETLEDIPGEMYLPTIVVATSETPGECIYDESGEVLTGVGPATVDMRTYGAYMDYRVEEVLKGDAALTGQVITVYEKMFHKDGELVEPRCVGLGSQRVLLCLYNGSDGETYYIHIPEYFIMPIADDGTLDIWPYLNRTRARVTLDDFREMCALAAVQPEEVAQ